MDTLIKWFPVLILGLIIFKTIKSLKKNIIIDQYIKGKIQNSGIQNYGFQIGMEIYTLYSRLQADRIGLFDFVRLNREPNVIQVNRFFNRDFFDILKVHCPPRYHVKFTINENFFPLPYEESTACQLSKGEFVVYRKEKKGFSFVSKEIIRTNEWPPLLNQGQYIWDQ